MPLFNLGKQLFSENSVLETTHGTIIATIFIWKSRVYSGVVQLLGSGVTRAVTFSLNSLCH